MRSKQKIQATRFSKTKTVTAYFVAGHYLMCSSLAYAGRGFGGMMVIQTQEQQSHAL